MSEAENIPPEEHIDADDPRYDGFRIKEYWMATATAPDNQEAALYVDRYDAERHHLAPGPAMAADQRRLHHLRGFAQEMARFHQIEIHIRHFVSDGEDEVIS